jgi:hypothetical protein
MRETGLEFPYRRACGLFCPSASNFHFSARFHFVPDIQDLSLRLGHVWSKISALWSLLARDRARASAGSLLYSRWNLSAACSSDLVGVLPDSSHKANRWITGHSWSVPGPGSANRFPFGSLKQVSDFVAMCSWSRPSMIVRRLSRLMEGRTFVMWKMAVCRSWKGVAFAQSRSGLAMFHPGTFQPVSIGIR